MATELWRAAELKAGVLRAKLATAATLEPPCPDQRGLTSLFPKPELECYQRVAMIEASTMTDSVQTIEACTIMDSVQPIEDASPHPQTIHDPTPPLPPPLIMEQFAQTDTPSLLGTRPSMRKITQQSVVKKNLHIRERARYAQREREREAQRI